HVVLLGAGIGYTLRAVGLMRRVGPHPRPSSLTRPALVFADTRIRKSEPSHMQRSTRASCSELQTPYRGSFGREKGPTARPSRIGSFVDSSATEMLISMTAAARRMKSPKRIRVPHTISATPTKGPMSSGDGIPTFTKRPAPSSIGYKNFWIPSERNTIPTIRRMRMIALEPEIRRCCGIDSIEVVYARARWQPRLPLRPAASSEAARTLRKRLAGGTYEKERKGNGRSAQPSGRDGSWGAGRRRRGGRGRRRDGRPGRSRDRRSRRCGRRRRCGKQLRLGVRCHGGSATLERPVSAPSVLPIWNDLRALGARLPLRLGERAASGARPPLFRRPRGRARRRVAQGAAGGRRRLAPLPGRRARRLGPHSERLKERRLPVTSRRRERGLSGLGHNRAGSDRFGGKPHQGGSASALSDFTEGLARPAPSATAPVSSRDVGPRRTNRARAVNNWWPFRGDAPKRKGAIVPPFDPAVACRLTSASVCRG